MSEEKKLTGYPSIDKPWLKYYSADLIHSEIPKMNAYEYMCLCNKDNMDCIAITYEKVSITYKKMIERISTVAANLINMGINKGDTIASCLPNIPEAIYLIYAAAKIGVTIDLFDPLFNEDIVAKYCNNSNPKIFFSLDVMSGTAIKNLGKCKYEKLILVSPFESISDNKNMIAEIQFNDSIMSWSDFINKNSSAYDTPIEYEPNMPLAILHTGGTTGVPKGAVLSHDSVNSSAYQTLHSPLEMRANETVLNLMPPFSSYGLCYGIHVHLSAGMQLILIPSYDPEQIGEQLIKYKPNRFAATPAHIECLLISSLLKKIDLSFLHHPMVGGDTLAYKTEIKINELLLKNGCKDKIVKGYGLTETSGGVCFCVDNKVNKLQSVGIPLFKNIIAVFDVDNYNNELQYNQVGEIAVLSENNMLGYLNMPEETEKTLIKHSDGKVWLHTGDLGKIDEDGIVFIDGRMRRMIIQSSGLKSNPFEVEEQIIKHPFVKRAVVVGVRDLSHEQGELPVAFVESYYKNVNEEELKNQLYEICKESVTYYSMPIDYVLIDKFPETSRGKIDFRKLSDKYEKIAQHRNIFQQRQLKI